MRAGNQFMSPMFEALEEKLVMSRRKMVLPLVDISDIHGTWTPDGKTNVYQKGEETKHSGNHGAIGSPWRTQINATGTMNPSPSMGTLIEREIVGA